MKSLDLDMVGNFVDRAVADFHQQRLKALKKLDFIGLLTKNLYLCKQRYLITPGWIVSGSLEVYLSSIEDKLFDDLMKRVVVFIVNNTAGGYKSEKTGIYLEFYNNETLYLVSIESGLTLRDDLKQKALEMNFSKAIAILRQSGYVGEIQPMLGICFGPSRMHPFGKYRKAVGQGFWYMISENKDLYGDIIEPNQHQALDCDKVLADEKARKTNDFTKLLLNNFLTPESQIDWLKLVEFKNDYKNLDHVLI